MLNPIKAASLNLDGINHAFFTRDGGKSKGIYSGLNVGLGSNDDKETVGQNRAIAAGYFNVPATHLTTPYQIHSPNVIVATKPFSNDKPKADAIVTAIPKLMIGILTADCGPVLFADHKSSIVGAAHAGWKGATSGILENTIDAMENLGANKKDIIAVLGPTISQPNYEVGPEFIENLVSLEKRNTAYLINSTKADHFMFDLPSYIVDRLTAAGVKASWTGQCTYAQEEKLFSYRRTTHRNEADYGRQLSAIQIL